MTERARRAEEAGATAVLVAQTAARVTQAFSPDGEASGVSLPVALLERADADSLRAALCPRLGASGQCTGGEPVRGTLRTAAGDWGALRIFDISDAAKPREIAVRRAERAGTFPPPDLGVYSVHHAMVRDGLAYVAWNSDGLRVLDLTAVEPVEIGSYLPPDQRDPSGVFPAKAYVVGVALLERDRRYVIIPDVHSGLYVLDEPRSSP